MKSFLVFEQKYSKDVYEAEIALTDIDVIIWVKTNDAQIIWEVDFKDEREVSDYLEKRNIPVIAS